ncbi:MAG: hypothetical protein PHE27_04360 [Alphaproteobacteria bacterium]|nr:hypothetical protein [Alphaproteobacteria bacterium]
MYNYFPISMIGSFERFHQDFFAGDFMSDNISRTTIDVRLPQSYFNANLFYGQSVDFLSAASRACRANGVPDYVQSSLSLLIGDYTDSSAERGKDVVSESIKEQVRVTVGTDKDLSDEQVSGLATALTIATVEVFGVPRRNTEVAIVKAKTKNCFIGGKPAYTL